MTPEEKARIKIDRMFEDADWQVVDRMAYTPTITAAAIREGLLKGNHEAVYFLFINGKAIGVLEAKRAEVDVTNSKVCEQTAMYVRTVPNCYQAWSKPLPFGYQSNGETTYFCDFREQNSGLDLINRIHTPDEDGDEPSDPVELPDNPKLPKDFFDLIIIDECHRSIYGNWKKVLDYFGSAKMIGLTATPVPETLAFFNKNIIVNYTLEKSIIDNVNVDCRIFRIKTEATENGGAIKQGDKLSVETRYTGKVETISQKETKQYTKIEVMRQIVEYVATNGACGINEIRQDDMTKAAQLIKAFGGLEKANNALYSLYKFVVYHKTA